MNTIISKNSSVIAALTEAAEENIASKAILFNMSDVTIFKLEFFNLSGQYTKPSASYTATGVEHHNILPDTKYIIEGYAMITSKGTAMTFSEVKEVKSRKTVMID